MKKTRRAEGHARQSIYVADTHLHRVVVLQVALLGCPRRYFVAMFGKLEINYFTLQ